MPETPSVEVLTDQMVSATYFVEAAARTWQEDNPRALPACFLMACARFVADSFASASDDAFEAMLQKMREERIDWQKGKSNG